MEHLPLCNIDEVKEELKPPRAVQRVQPPPGLKLHNMFMDLMEDDMKDDDEEYGKNKHKQDEGMEMMALFNPDEEVNHIRAERKWTKFEAVVDSGAAESVAPAAMVPWIPARASEGSRRGQCYMAANGAKLPNLGEKHFSMVTTEGNLAEATFQVAEVTRPLCSVTKICDRGNRVVFSAEGGYIENLATGVQTSFMRQNNVYVMEMYVEEPSGAAAIASGFPG